MEEEEVLSNCRQLLEKGVIRRFGPSINHRKLGYDANPMTVLKVPEEMVDEVGNQIARESDVTHCYSRSGWDYNLFFMVHAISRDEGELRAKEIVRYVGGFEHRILFSIRELKKTSFEIPKAEVCE
jgi:DNA-binding Lrp family transcriptional regulator